MEPLSEPTVHYARTSDGVRVGFVAAGQGRPLLYLRFFGHALREWELPVIGDWYRALTAHHQVVLIDPRNFGASERGCGDISLQTCLADIQAVIDRLGLTTFDVFALGDLCPAAVALAARFPTSVRQVVLWSPGLRIEDWHTAEEIARGRLHSVVDSVAGMDGRMALELMLGDLFGDAPVSLAQKRAFIHAVVLPDDLLEYQRFLAGVDAWEIAPQVQAPTLAVHPRGLEWPTAAERIAATVQSGQYVEVEGEGGPYFGLREERLALVEAFLSTGKQPAQRALRPALSPLSPREAEVVGRVREGETNREIAAALGVSEATVARHLANIFAKTGARNRAHLTALLPGNDPGDA